MIPKRGSCKLSPATGSVYGAHWGRQSCHCPFFPHGLPSRKSSSSPSLPPRYFSGQPVLVEATRWLLVRPDVTQEDLSQNQPAESCLPDFTQRQQFPRCGCFRASITRELSKLASSWACPQFLLAAGGSLTS